MAAGDHQLTAEPDGHACMKSMREELKAVERLRKAMFNWPRRGRDRIP